MIVFDTNFIIAAMQPGTSQAIQVDVWERAGEKLRVSAMAWSEFLCGPLSQREKDTAAMLLGRPVPITAADAEQAAELFNRTGRRRGSLADCLIAAAALRAGATLATANLADFSPFASFGLRIVS